MTYCFDKVPSPNNWTVAIFCLLLLILTVEAVQYRRKISLLVKSLFSQRHFSLLLREGRVMEDFLSVVLVFLDLSIYAFGLQLVMARFHPEIVERLTFVGCWGVLLLGLLLLFGAKNLSNKIYAVLYDREKEVYDSLLYKFAFLTDSALVLFPILVVVAFTKHFELLYAFIPVFCVFAVVWVFKLLKINPRKINMFHFFIYFCTLEILPYLVLVKLIAMI